MSRNPTIKAIFFDFMGTCLDWHTPVLSALPPSIPAETASALAISWRHTYFDPNAARLAANLPPEDIDITLRATLLSTLSSPAYSQYQSLVTEDTLEKMHRSLPQHARLA